MNGQKWGAGKCKYCDIQMPMKPLRSGVNEYGPFIKCVSICPDCHYKVIEQIPYDQAIKVADAACFPSRETILARDSILSICSSSLQ